MDDSITPQNAPSPGYAGREDAVQDQQGNWWYQDSTTAVWYIWNGQAWQPVPAAAPRIPPPQSAPTPKSGRPGFCLLTLFTGGLIGLLVVGGLSLVAYNFFPAYHIIPGPGDVVQILNMGAGGLLLAAFGLFMLKRGFGTLLTHRAMLEDEWVQHTAISGCGAVMNGLGQLFFGLFFLTVGLGLLTLALYQEILPWLGL